MTTPAPPSAPCPETKNGQPCLWSEGHLHDHSFRKPYSVPSANDREVRVEWGFRHPNGTVGGPIWKQEAEYLLKAAPGGALVRREVILEPWLDVDPNAPESS